MLFSNEYLAFLVFTIFSLSLAYAYLKFYRFPLIKRRINALENFSPMEYYQSNYEGVAFDFERKKMAVDNGKITTVISVSDLIPKSDDPHFIENKRSKKANVIQQRTQDSKLPLIDLLFERAHSAHLCRNAFFKLLGSSASTQTNHFISNYLNQNFYSYRETNVTQSTQSQPTALTDNEEKQLSISVANWLLDNINFDPIENSPSPHFESRILLNFSYILADHNLDLIFQKKCNFKQSTKRKIIGLALAKITKEKKADDFFTYSRGTIDGYVTNILRMTDKQKLGCFKVCKRRLKNPLTIKYPNMQ